MTGKLGIHRPNNGHLINTLRQAWKQIADLNPALTVLLEFERARQRHSRLPLSLQILKRQHLPGPASQFRFRIKRIDL